VREHAEGAPSGSADAKGALQPTFERWSGKTNHDTSIHPQKPS